MKISANRADAFAARPDPAMHAVLVYGPDRGLVRERARMMVQSVVPDDDAFRSVTLTGAQVKDDPARLADEAAAISMIGGRRVVRIDEATDGLSSIVAQFLEQTPGDALVVVEAGELGPRSSLRKLFESAKNAAALPCYADNARDLEGVIDDFFREQKLSVRPDAMAYLLDNLGSDRRVTRLELEKLALYCGGTDQAEVTLADAAACVGDSAGLAIDDMVFAAADGDMASLDRILTTVFREGANAVSLLRAALRHMQRLHIAAARVETGESAAAAVQSLRPPVFFKFRDRVARQLGWWSVDRIGRTMTLLLDAEMACKRTGAPDTAIAERALMGIASAAVRGRKGR